jgi:hypothetical protein
MSAVRAGLAFAALLSATPALADPQPDPQAEHIADALTHRLNAHGRQFVASEGHRLAIGDASQSGAKDDVREACLGRESCLKIKDPVEAGDIEGAMLLLAAQRAQQLETQLIDQLKHGLETRNSQIARLNADLQNTTDKDRQSDLKSQLEKLNGDSQLDMIEIQRLVNKRNEAFDMLTNLLNKHQKALDSIIQNMR